MLCSGGATGDGSIRRKLVRGFARHSWNAYKGGGAFVVMALLMLALSLIPKSFGNELTILVVIGLPVVFIVVVMLHGSKVNNRAKHPRKSRRVDR